MITTRANRQLKNVRKLLNSSKERKETGLFVTEGMRLFSEIPEELIETVFLSEEYEKEYRERIKHLDVPVEVVESGLFREISDTVHPQGILAVVRQPRFPKETKLSDGKILLLDGIRDPGNLGTILRTAEAAGIRQVYLSMDCVDLYNPKVIRSTMGSIFRVRTFREDLSFVIENLKAEGIPVYATSLKAEKSYKDIDLDRCAIIIGSEANGISEPILRKATDIIKIPMQGRVESLNAAVSAAILMFA